jgi:hypothetical protein
VQAWYTVRKFDGIQLGKKQDIAHESYTQWVIERAVAFGMPYTIPRHVSANTMAFTPRDQERVPRAFACVQLRESSFGENALQERTGL